MKNILIVIAAWLPLISLGQKFEVSEMMGYSKEVSSIYDNVGVNAKASGLSNQISFNYYPAKVFSVGLCYENDFWQPSFYSIGVMPIIHLHWLYFGTDISALHIGDMKEGNRVLQSFKTSFSFNAIAGVKKKISKHFDLKGQISFDVSNLSTNGSYIFGNSPKSLDFNYVAALVGIAYHF